LRPGGRRRQIRRRLLHRLQDLRVAWTPAAPAPGENPRIVLQRLYPPREQCRMIGMSCSVRRVHALDDALIDGLAAVLVDCVEGGASVSFMLPLSRERAAAFWREVANGVAAGTRVLIVAEDEKGICGTVQLLLDQPENQPHRADLSKVLVHRRARRRSVGEALMRAAEAAARE